MSAAAAEATQTYSRDQVRRLLRVTERQLVSFEKQGLAEARKRYDFHDLLALQSIVRLRQQKIRLPQIRRALEALRRTLHEIRDPLRELRLYADAKRMRVEIDGRPMDPESGQLLLDFDKEQLRRLVAMPDSKAQLAREARASAERWFERALELEQTGAPVSDIIDAYQTVIALDPLSAGALVNLGTVYFNLKKFPEAEKYYRKALEADPGYPLAHFDLGNLFDERNDRGRALFHYQAALRLNPQYADAHYNIALLYQGSGQGLKAVGHWKAYLRLDPSSHWAAVARRELAKLRDEAIVRGALS